MYVEKLCDLIQDFFPRTLYKEYVEKFCRLICISVDHRDFFYRQKVLYFIFSFSEV